MPAPGGREVAYPVRRPGAPSIFRTALCRYGPSGAAARSTWRASKVELPLPPDVPDDAGHQARQAHHE